MLIHIIADFGQGDLAFAEVVQRLKLYLPEAEPVLTSVPPFSTLAAGFCVAQLALNEAPPDTVVFHNVAPRADDKKARINNAGERLVLARLPSGVKVVGVHAGYAFSFLAPEADMHYLSAPAEGSQFRSRDVFPAVVAAVAKGDAPLAEPLSAGEVLEVPPRRVAYVDGFGNLKTTIPAGAVQPGEVRVRIGQVTQQATVSGGGFAVRHGQLAFSPGSSGWPRQGETRRWMELFFRGGSAQQAFGYPEVGAEIQVSPLAGSARDG